MILPKQACVCKWEGTMILPKQAYICQVGGDYGSSKTSLHLSSGRGL